MQFTYKARTRAGELKTGIVEARTADAAVDALQRGELIVIDVRPVGGEAAPFLGKQFHLFSSSVSQRDVVLFSRQLATLFQAKVPILQALKTLGDEAENPTLAVAIGNVVDDLSGGASLSQAFSRHPAIFSRFYLSMVRAGEESGKLEDVFNYLADYLERAYELASKARNAMIYPAFVFSTFFIVLAVMLVVVIPKFTAIFDELGQKPPFYTALVISISSLLRRFGVVILVFLAGGAIALWRYVHTERGGRWFDEVKLRTPIVGSIMQKIYLTRIADNLATLIVGGIPIMRALEITADVVANRVYGDIILDARESVKAGNTISASFEKFREIPRLVSQMIRVGEESGRLDFILKSTAHFYRREVDSLLENFVSLIEPALIVFLGVGVGLLVAAVLVPLYNITTAFG
ncbi:MAG: hypothetical protein A3B37_03825 [Candidatus Sungbacteria bacterium RIFCSPLOWO2_01_FULL_59_16]|uniref:Type II secretion system protein GspF domain-containing protein n=1 Tax=Candidatus Sungbacteria bacterium RIFCSPLOWO2_01_FULL_59_16 TaxID=1802280 RepID=A0A1G2L953_9BACT|nr:MAG: hypothetical protein A3B37_03825 [Candidatus Sungbacteria bacterium RIFCSPLOWO2_01_FULL_59_16]